MLAPLSWPTDTDSAIAVQEQLRQQVRLVNDFPTLRYVAGLDVGYDQTSSQSFAVAVLMQLDALKPIAIVRAQQPTSFPYVPGLLSFREIPVLMEALEHLPHAPDVLMVDGHGIAHPRRLGIAAHLGVLINKPTIGVAKSRLVGSFAEPGMERGNTNPLMHKQQRIGTVLRSKTGCNPLFISPGHRIDHAMTLEIVMHCLRGYRLPEPTRVADKYSKRAERERVTPGESHTQQALAL